MHNPKPSVFEFTSFRSFLKAYAEDSRRANPHWSLASWAKKLGLQGTASLTMVVNGQRSAGPHVTEALVRYFKFNEKEKRFFVNLINLDKVGNQPSLKYLVLDELRRLSPDKEFKLLDEKAFSTISNWFHLAIRQMVRLKSFKPDKKWIADHLIFPVTEKQVAEALQNLLDLNLIENKNGKWSKTTQHLSTANDLSAEAIKRFHEQSLENAKKAVREVPVEEREIRSVTLTFNPEKMTKAKELLREFCIHFDNVMDSDDGTNVYQMNIQLLPLTKNLDSKK